MPDLLPCPFCGEKQIFLNEPSPTYRKGCINCPACLVVMPGEVNTDELINSWNTRDADHAQDAYKCLAPCRAACAWPDCGCDPYATKVIKALVDDGWQAPPECRSPAANSSVECGDCPPSGFSDKERCSVCPQRLSSGRETELLATLVYESMRFSIWAAGQGLMAEKGEPTLDPEDFLFDYSKAMDIDDWNGLAEVARDHIKAQPQTATRTPAASEGLSDKLLDGLTAAVESLQAELATEKEESASYHRFWIEEREKRQRAEAQIALLKTDVKKWNDAYDLTVSQVEAASACAQFVKWALQEGSWQGGDLDGGGIQDKAEELGLIQKVPYDPAKHGESEFGAEPGDDWYVLADPVAALSVSSTEQSRG